MDRTGLCGFGEGHGLESHRNSLFVNRVSGERERESKGTGGGERGWTSERKRPFAEEIVRIPDARRTRY